MELNSHFENYNILNSFAISFKCIQLLLQSHFCILKKTHFELNRFKDDNVKIVFASTLNVFLLVIKTCSRFCLLPLGMPNHHPLR